MNRFNGFFHFNNKKGAMLPIVLLLVLILMLMVTPMLKLSVQQLNLAKSQENINFAYVSSGSMTEKVMKEIKDYVNNASNYSSITYVDDNQYAREIVTQIETAIKSIFNNTSDSKIKVIDLSSAEAIAQVKSIDFIKCIPDLTSNKLAITVGIITSSGFTRNNKSVSGTEIYSELTFYVDKPTNNFKPAAVNGIGDLFVTGGMKSIIKGDVKLVGTAPAKTRQPEQYYYGGIYAKSGGQLEIDGSAFVRAFIRCGDMSDIDLTVNPAGDNSFINITKNAVAQSIQIFGSNDRILIHNDAFTFDDLEMNGLNSIIAVNRNFFGLSKGKGKDGQTHDASSAIVNSAIVHHPDEESILEAQKSKIIINGDVFINGGTYWINPETGDLLHGAANAQIEDASTAWNKSDEIPSYKNYDPVFESKPYHGDIDSLDNNWINQEYSAGRAYGYGNLFQVWSVQSDPLNWFTSTAMTSRKIYNDFAYSIASKISGLCSYEIAANGSLYSMVYTQMSGSTAEDESKIKRATNVLDSNQNFIDSLYYIDDSASKQYTDSSSSDYWEKYWTVSLSSSWDEYIDRSIDYLDRIRAPLKAITEDFITREYIFGTQQEIVNSLVPSKDPSISMFDYIGIELKKCNDENTSLVLTDDEMGSSLVNGATGNYDIGRFANDLSKYYIIVNMNPDKTIEIDQEINGIIYTKGKVVLVDGGKLNGFIIAAGQGCNPVDGSVIDSAADPGRIPQVFEDGSNLDKLDNGSYAAVVFKGTTGQAEINFKLGTSPDPTPEESLNFLISQYSDNGIKNILNRIF